MVGVDTGNAELVAASGDVREREAAHRARNALQLISSLILLQERHCADVAAARAMAALLRRVAAVSAAYRHTAWIEDCEQVDAATLVREIVGDLTRSAGRADVVVELDLEPTVAPGHMATPLALMASETIGNALGHAFPSGQTGRILVALRTETGRLELCVDDDGVGPPPQMPTTGLGLTVVKLMTQQVRGQLNLTPLNVGFRVSITAPLSHAPS